MYSQGRKGLRKDDRRRRHPKVVADLMGHDVNVNLNVYTQTPLEAKLEAVGVLESAFVN
jgi:hypothetical protein